MLVDKTSVRAIGSSLSQEPSVSAEISNATRPSQETIEQHPLLVPSGAGEGAMELRPAIAAFIAAAAAAASAKMNASSNGIHLSDSNSELV